MKNPNIQITHSDYNRLQDLLHDDAMYRFGNKENREALARELLRAKIMSAGEISPDVVTLHSRARLRDLQTGEVLELTIVLPEEADSDSDCISILAPLGTAMLGYCKGDVFEWDMPGGHSRFQVDEVLFQPESIGRDYGEPVR